MLGADGGDVEPDGDPLLEPVVEGRLQDLGGLSYGEILRCIPLPTKRAAQTPRSGPT